MIESPYQRRVRERQLVELEDERARQRELRVMFRWFCIFWISVTIILLVAFTDWSRV